MRGHLTRRMLVARALQATLVVGGFLLPLGDGLALRESVRAGDRSHAVVLAATSVQGLVVDLETGVRGYQATGDGRVLDPWRAARRELPRRTGRLEALAAGTPAQAPARALAAAASDYLHAYSEPLVRRERAGAAAPRGVTVRAGKRRVDAIRADARQLVAAEAARARAARVEAAARGRRAMRGVAAAVVLAIVVVLLVAAWMARTVVGPVRRLGEAARRLAAGDLTVRVAAHGVDEVGTLGVAFNEMAQAVQDAQGRADAALAGLRASHDRFRAVIDATLDGLVVLEAVRGDHGAVRDFRFVEMNGHAETALPGGRDAVGRTLTEAFPGESWEPLVARYCDVMATGVPVDEEFPVPTPDGGEPAHWYHQVVPFGDGVLVTTRDVTAGRRAEQAVRALTHQHAEDLAAVADVMRTLPGTADAATARRLICEGARALCAAGVAALLEPADDRGLAATAAAGADPAGLAVPIDGAASVAGRVFETGVAEVVPDLAADGDVHVGERGAGMQTALWQPVVRGGRTLAVLLVAWPADVAVHGQRAAGIVRLLAEEAAVAMERADFVAELAGLNRVLELQLEALRISDQMKTDFVSSVSHELRTPLTAILGYLDVLGEDDVPGEAERREFLAIVAANARRLLALIDDLLTLAGLESGRMRMRTRVVDLGALVADAVRDLRPAADAKAQRLSLVLPAAEAPVAVDPGRIAQVLSNLLANAVKFTGDGGRVDVAVTAAGDRVRVTVADTGIGIPADQQGYLFDRFFRARNATEGAIPGTGLGLAIARTIVEAHGGELACRSDEGRGSEFALTLPAAPAAAAAA